jgi:uncharacterized membrane protein
MNDLINPKKLSNQSSKEYWIYPVDIIAILIIIGVLISNWRGTEFMVPMTLLLVVGFYFGDQFSRVRKLSDKTTPNV